MGSKIKGWHNRGPQKDKRRMYEESSSRRPKNKDRDRKSFDSKRVDYSRFMDNDSNVG